MIRQANPNDAKPIAKIHVDAWRSTYKNIWPDDFLASLSYQEREKRWAERLSDTDQPRFVYVAEPDHSGIVGFVAGGPERSGELDFDGEIYAIYLAQHHQRKGLGRKLFDAGVQWLIDNDFHSMAIWSLEANLSAKRFYEAMGGVASDDKIITIGGVELKGVAYGWRKIG